MLTEQKKGEAADVAGKKDTGTSGGGSGGGGDVAATRAKINDLLAKLKVKDQECEGVKTQKGGESQEYIGCVYSKAEFTDQLNKYNTQLVIQQRQLAKAKEEDKAEYDKLVESQRQLLVCKAAGARCDGEEENIKKQQDALNNKAEDKKKNDPNFDEQTYLLYKAQLSGQNQQAINEARFTQINDVANRLAQARLDLRNCNYTQGATACTTLGSRVSDLEVNLKGIPDKWKAAGVCGNDCKGIEDVANNAYIQTQKIADEAFLKQHPEIVAQQQAEQTERYTSKQEAVDPELKATNKAKGKEDFKKANEKLADRIAVDESALNNEVCDHPGQEKCSDIATRITNNRNALKKIIDAPCSTAECEGQAEAAKEIWAAADKQSKAETEGLATIIKVEDQAVAGINQAIAFVNQAGANWQQAKKQTDNLETAANQFNAANQQIMNGGCRNTNNCETLIAIKNETEKTLKDAVEKKCVDGTCAYVQTKAIDLWNQTQANDKRLHDEAAKATDVALDQAVKAMAEATKQEIYEAKRQFNQSVAALTSNCGSPEDCANYQKQRDAAWNRLTDIKDRPCVKGDRDYQACVDNHNLANTTWIQVKFDEKKAIASQETIARINKEAETKRNQEIFKGAVTNVIDTVDNLLNQAKVRVITGQIDQASKDYLRISECIQGIRTDCPTGDKNTWKEDLAEKAIFLEQHKNVEVCKEKERADLCEIYQQQAQTAQAAVDVQIQVDTVNHGIKQAKDKVSEVANSIVGGISQAASGFNKAMDEVMVVVADTKEVEDAKETYMTISKIINTGQCPNPRACSILNDQRLKAMEQINAQSAVVCEDKTGTELIRCQQKKENAQKALSEIIAVDKKYQTDEIVTLGANGEQVVTKVQRGVIAQTVNNITNLVQTVAGNVDRVSKNLTEVSNAGERYAMANKCTINFEQECFTVYGFNQTNLKTTIGTTYDTLAMYMNKDCSKEPNPTECTMYQDNAKKMFGEANRVINDAVNAACLPSATESKCSGQGMVCVPTGTSPYVGAAITYGKCQDPNKLTTDTTTSTGNGGVDFWKNIFGAVDGTVRNLQTMATNALTYTSTCQLDGAASQGKCCSGNSYTVGGTSICGMSPTYTTKEGKCELGNQSVENSCANCAYGVTQVGNEWQCNKESAVNNKVANVNVQDLPRISQGYMCSTFSTGGCNCNGGWVGPGGICQGSACSEDKVKQLKEQCYGEVDIGRCSCSNKVYVGLNADQSVNKRACPSDPDINVCECSDGSVANAGGYCLDKNAQVQLVSFKNDKYVQASFDNYVNNIVVTKPNEEAINNMVGGLEQWGNRTLALIQNGNKLPLGTLIGLAFYQATDLITLGGLSATQQAAVNWAECNAAANAGKRPQGCGMETVLAGVAGTTMAAGTVSPKAGAYVNQKVTQPFSEWLREVGISLGFIKTLPVPAFMTGIENVNGLIKLARNGNVEAAEYLNSLQKRGVVLVQENGTWVEKTIAGDVSKQVAQFEAGYNKAFSEIKDGSWLGRSTEIEVAGKKLSVRYNANGYVENIDEILKNVDDPVERAALKNSLEIYNQKAGINLNASLSNSRNVPTAYGDTPCPIGAVNTSRYLAMGTLAGQVLGCTEYTLPGNVNKGSEVDGLVKDQFPDATEIGHGNYGYAYDVNGGKEVAKVLNPDVYPDDALWAMHDQYNYLKKMKGTGGLPKVTGEIWDADGTLVGFTMEKLPGEPLAAFSGNLSVDDAYKAMNDYLDMGRPHGDLHGNNVLIETHPDGTHQVHFIDPAGDQAFEGGLAGSSGNIPADMDAAKYGYAVAECKKYVALLQSTCKDCNNPQVANTLLNVCQ
jgi:hypothetical protein